MGIPTLVRQHNLIEIAHNSKITAGLFTEDLWVHTLDPKKSWTVPIYSRFNEPMRTLLVTNPQLHHWEKISIKSKLEYKNFLQENAFASLSAKMVAILSKPQCLYKVKEAA